jgi:hypothetical protein
MTIIIIQVLHPIMRLQTLRSSLCKERPALYPGERWKIYISFLSREIPLLTFTMLARTQGIGNVLVGVLNYGSGNEFGLRNSTHLETTLCSVNRSTN